MYKHGFRYQKKRDKRPILLLIIVVIFSASLFLASARSILSFPVLTGVSAIDQSAYETKEVKLEWPKYGQSAIGAKGYGVLEANTDKKAQPTASVAKVMTVMAILEKYPLKPGEQGPNIKMSALDEDLFGWYLARNGTSVRVKAGEEMSLYKALQYILVSSANNIADTAAVWAFGSMEDYSKFADEYAKTLGMESSHFADGSGFSPKTVSTASDLVRLADKAMQNPVVAEIVRTWEIELPDGHKAYNSNVFLEYNGNRVIGIKTGDTDQAGGVYMFAGETDVAGETITIVGVVMGAKTLSKAEHDSMKLLASAKKGFSSQKIISQGEVLGKYDVPWQSAVEVKSDSDIYAITWANKVPEINVRLDNISEALLPGTRVGEVSYMSAGVVNNLPLGLAADVQSPATIWRLKRYL